MATTDPDKAGRAHSRMPITTTQAERRQHDVPVHWADLDKGALASHAHALARAQPNPRKRRPRAPGLTRVATWASATGRSHPVASTALARARPPMGRRRPHTHTAGPGPRRRRHRHKRRRRGTGRGPAVHSPPTRRAGAPKRAGATAAMPAVRRGPPARRWQGRTPVPRQPAKAPRCATSPAARRLGSGTQPRQGRAQAQERNLPHATWTKMATPQAHPPEICGGWSESARRCWGKARPCARASAASTSAAPRAPEAAQGIPAAEAPTPAPWPRGGCSCRRRKAPTAATPAAWTSSPRSPGAAVRATAASGKRLGKEFALLLCAHGDRLCDQLFRPPVRPSAASWPSHTNPTCSAKAAVRVSTLARCQLTAQRADKHPENAARL